MVYSCLKSNTQAFFLDDSLNQGTKVFGDCSVLGKINGLLSCLNPLNSPVFIAIGDNNVRRELALRFSSINWATIIHPKSYIHESVEIGEGSIVMAGAVIQPGTKIGKHCIINTGATIDHDCIIADFSHIAPGTTLCGGVRIGEATMIGAGSILVPEVSVGEYSLVCAGTVLSKDVPPQTKVKSQALIAETFPYLPHA